MSPLGPERIEHTESSNALAHADVALPAGRSLSVSAVERGAQLRLYAPSGQVELELEIVVTPSGAVVRARAAALELDAVGDVTTRCESFRVEARGRIDLRAGTDLVQQAARGVEIEAQTASVRVRANDDVQLLGEHVLLNCDRPAAVPPWLTEGAVPTTTLPAVAASGDPELLAVVTAPEP